MTSFFPDYKETSIKRWVSSCKKIMNDCFQVQSFDEYYYENVRYYKQYIFSIDNKSVRKNLTCAMYKSVQCISSDLTTVFEKFFLRISKEADDERRYRRPNKKEVAQHKTWDELVQIRRDLFLKRDKSNNDFIRYYVASLYTKCPPLRQQDLLGAFVDIDDKNKNYIDTEKKILYVKSYKTQKYYGDREVPLEPSLVTTIKKYKNKFKTNIALCKVSDSSKPMSSAGFSQYLKNIFGCSVCTLRKIYISEMLDNENATVEQRKRVSLIMAHSMFAQEFIYSVYSKRHKYE